ncbi:MAG: tRNA pseudouridine(55) synthase TruB [Myxococcota bacterium]
MSIFMVKIERAHTPARAQGILLVDKPAGPSSFAVVAQVRRALGVRRVGHAGTLDPLASGLLVVLVGNYTRLSDLLLGGDKTYEARIAFGVSTQTDDAEGQVLRRADASHLNEQMVEQVCQSFVGDIQQQPPIYSAIHVNGKRAYQYARKGQNVQLPLRKVSIHSLQLLAWQAPYATVRVHCSKGTYMRALARDVGKALQLPAHLAQLRRTHSGCYAVADAVCGSNLSDSCALLAAMRTGVAAVPNLPHCAIGEREAIDLRCGRTIAYRQGDVQAAAVKQHALGAGSTRARAVHVESTQSQQLASTDLLVARSNNTLVALVRPQLDRLLPVRVFADPSLTPAPTEAKQRSRSPKGLQLLEG